MIAARHPRRIAHPLLDDAPFAVGGEEEDVVIELVAVLDRGAVHLGGSAARVDQRLRVAADRRHRRPRSGAASSARRCPCRRRRRTPSRGRCPSALPSQRRTPSSSRRSSASRTRARSRRPETRTDPRAGAGCRGCRARWRDRSGFRATGAPCARRARLEPCRREEEGMRNRCGGTHRNLSEPGTACQPVPLRPGLAVAHANSGAEGRARRARASGAARGRRGLSSTDCVSLPSILSSAGPPRIQRITATMSFSQSM